MTGRERVINHLDGKPVDCLPAMPITMMFAADQIGAKYRDYAADHRVMVEAQIATARKFDFDYVSVISDPAREAADLGADIHYFEDQPPAIIESNARLADKNELAWLDFPNPLGGGRMHDRIQAVSLFKQRIGDEKLIEGWVEGPCAEAADLRGINTLMLDFHDDPKFVRELFGFVTDNALRFARPQVEAGAGIIGIGDAAASLIGPQLYVEFAVEYERKLIGAIHAMGCRTRLHICGRTTKLLPWMGNLGSDMVDLDWMVPFTAAREQSAEGQVLSGNIDPVAVLRNGTPPDVQAKLAECHRGAGPRYIVCAGCEIVRDTPEENVHAMVEYARSQRS